MGFSVQNVEIIRWLKHNQLIKSSDSILELGCQQINNDVIDNLASLDSLADLFGVPRFSNSFKWSVKDRKFLASGMQHLPQDAPFAKKLYEHLGFKYCCVDLDDNPDSIKMDLNYDQVAEKHKGRYSLVTNLGTTEHVANQLNAFKIIHDFTAINGVMVHVLPFQGFSTHGFVSYSMQFFWMLCRSNLYKVIDVDMAAWQRTSIPGNVLDFVKENSRIFTNKKDVENLEFQDTGIFITLQKCQDIDFVPPIDVPNGTRTNDPEIKKRYWTVFGEESLK